MVLGIIFISMYITYYYYYLQGRKEGNSSKRGRRGDHDSSQTQCAYSLFWFHFAPLVLVSDANPPPSPLFSLFLRFPVSHHNKSQFLFSLHSLVSHEIIHPHPPRTHTKVTRPLSLGESKQAFVFGS